MSYTRSYPRYPQKNTVEKVGLHSMENEYMFCEEIIKLIISTEK